MFWERSDSALSDEVLRSLQYIDINYYDVEDALWTMFGANPSVMPCLGGTFNRSYRVRAMQHGIAIDHPDAAKIARFNVSPSPSTQALHLEQWVNNEAIRRGFPTPRIIHVDTSCAYSQYPFQVIEYSDGVPLRGQGEETTQKALGQLGRALRKLHDKPIGDRFGRVGLGTVPEWDMFWREEMDAHAQYCLDRELITSAQFEQIYAVGDFDAPVLECAEPRLLHADLSYDNILLDRTSLDLKAVIDWEDAILGDPIFELAGLATFHPEDRHKVFIDTYYADGARPDDFEYRFWIYYLRIALAKAVHRHRFGYTDEGGEGRQAADERIALALARLKELT